MDTENTTTPDETAETADAPTEDSATESADAAQETSEEEQLGDAGKRALDRMKRERNELRRELDKLRRQAMTEQERAVAEARDTGRAEAMREMAGRLVDAEIRSAASGRPLNVDALIANVDRSRFLTEDGEVDRDAIVSWLNELAPAQETPRRAADLGQGARGATRSSPADLFGQLITQNLK